MRGMAAIARCNAVSASPAKLTHLLYDLRFAGSAAVHVCSLAARGGAAPQLSGGTPRPLGHGLEFRPGNARVHQGMFADRRAEAAVRAGDDVLPAYDVGVAHE